MLGGGAEVEVKGGGGRTMKLDATSRQAKNRVGYSSTYFILERNSSASRSA